MALDPFDTDEPPAWDVLVNSENDLLVELDDLRAEIATREDRMRVVRELLATVRDSINRPVAAEEEEELP